MTVDLNALTDDDRTYLQSATAGTQVVLSGSTPRLRLVTIDRVTPKRLVVDGVYYGRANGRELGEIDSFYRSRRYLYPPTPERLVAVDLVIKEHRETAERNRLINIIDRTKFGNVSLATLQAIVKLIEEGQEST